MKTYKALTLFAAALLTFAACEEYDQQCHYPAAAAKSEIGKKLVENTKYIYSVYSDESWELEPGVEVTAQMRTNHKYQSLLLMKICVEGLNAMVEGFLFWFFELYFCPRHSSF